MKNRDRIPEGWDIALTDFSEGMVADAQQNLRERTHANKFAVMDAQSIEFEDKYFDAVVANHMLYHVPDRMKTFLEIRRVLRTGGHLYATTNGRTHLKELAWL